MLSFVARRCRAPLQLLGCSCSRTSSASTEQTVTPAAPFTHGADVISGSSSSDSHGPSACGVQLGSCHTWHTPGTLSAHASAALHPASAWPFGARAMSGDAAGQALNVQIRACSDLHSLLKLAQQNASKLDFKSITLLLRMASDKANLKGPDQQQEGAADDTAQQAELVQQLLSIAREHLSKCDVRGVWDMLKSLTRLNPKDAALMDKLVGHAEGLMLKFNTRDVVDVAYSLAKLQHPAPALWGKLLEQAQQKFALMKPQDLSRLLWAISQPHHAAPAPFTTELLGLAEKQLPKMWPRAIIEVAWALTKLQHEDRELMDRVLRAAARQLPELSEEVVAKELRMDVSPEVRAEFLKRLQDLREGGKAAAEVANTAEGAPGSRKLFGAKE